MEVSFYECFVSGFCNLELHYDFHLFFNAVGLSDALFLAPTKASSAAKVAECVHYLLFCLFNLIYSREIY